MVCPRQGGTVRAAYVDSLRREGPRPSLEEILSAVMAHFGGGRQGWSAGSRCDDISRSVAAYLARRQYGYSAAEIARALGYQGHGGVGTAVSRVETATEAVRKTLTAIMWKKSCHVGTESFELSAYR
ncbi:MAG: hypothetical protein HUU20_02650 [Pirellulales bacterium]|nr:hypothetical protein [Pirellulales bacterium]